MRKYINYGTFKDVCKLFGIPYEDFATQEWGEALGMTKELFDVDELHLHFVSNSRVDKMERRKKDLSCSYCRPHKNENAGRKAKHGAQKKRDK